MERMLGDLERVFRHLGLEINMEKLELLQRQRENPVKISLERILARLVGFSGVSDSGREHPG